MKTILIPFLLLLATAKAQTDTSRLNNPPPDSTGFGMPDGKLIIQQIGAAGGTIKSEDGRVELLFPQGALTTETTISIQSTTNLAPNGVGKSYSFQPSGIQFNKPVQLIFHYTDEEAEICPPEWMSLAMQDEKGKWTFIDYDDLDSSNKTLKGTIHHFSGFSNVNDLQLRRSSLFVPVNRKVDIFLDDISIPRESATNGLAIINSTESVLWYVNEIVNGNEQHGRIKGAEDDVSRSSKIVAATYTAPNILPPINGVKIWAEVYRRTAKKKKALKRRLVLRGGIDIIDMYQITILNEMKEVGVYKAELVDSASFIVTIFPSSINISEVKNFSPRLVKEAPSFGTGIAKTQPKIFTSNAQGMIEIPEKINNAVLSKNYPPIVSFDLQTKKVLVATIQLTVIKFNHTGPPEPLTVESVPDQIIFTASGEDQQTKHWYGGGGTLTVSVKRIPISW